MAESEIIMSVVPVGAATPMPTLAQAFTALCQALETSFVDMPDELAHARDIQGWHANGNVVISWHHAILLLEQALGAPVR